MKLQVTPILEGVQSAVPFEVNNLTPRHFVDLMDQHKALLIQNPAKAFSTDDFGQFLVDQQLKYYPYVGRAAPRTIIPTKARPVRHSGVDTIQMLRFHWGCCYQGAYFNAHFRISRRFVPGAFASYQPAETDHKRAGVTNELSNVNRM